MSAVIVPLAPSRRPPRPRGYAILYRPGQVNHCPGCGRSHWWVGRASAECAFCATALPFATGALRALFGKDA